MHLKYRPEIDGLRAIAIISVVLYHAEFFLGGRILFAGGFVGVDVFFVISGYLITLIILREMQSREFSFIKFYERRARRILPVLFTVMLVSTPFAWKYMLPNALKEYAGSVLSALAFSSNFIFWLEDGYTAEPSAFKPFLHTWSLSIEEQFYILFPVFLIIVWKFFRRNIVGFLLLTALLSLLIAEYASQRFPDAAFYLLPSRAWELLAGAILAKLELERGRINNRALYSTMPALGVFLITYSIFSFNEKTRHPSFITLLPVLGTMLVIWFSNRGEFVTRILSSQPLTALGLISYSLYLWHFPIFVFDKISNGELSAYDKLENIGLSVVFAILTYFVIEKPARNYKSFASLPLLGGLVASFIVLFTVNGYGLIEDGRVLDRTASVQEFLDSAIRDNAVLNDMRCHDYVQPCLVEAGDKAKTIVLVGDSHAGAISGELLKFSVRHGYGYAQFTSSACTHVEGFYNANRNPSFNAKCNENANSFKEFIKNNKNLVIVHMSYYPLWFSGKSFVGGEIVDSKQSPLSIIGGDDESPKERVVSQIQGWMKLGHTVVIIYPSPEAGVNLPKYFSNIFQDENKFALISRYQVVNTLDSVRMRAAEASAVFDSITGERLLRVKPESVFCSEQEKLCYCHDEESMYYTDADHLSRSGASKLIDAIAAELVRSEVRP